MERMTIHARKDIEEAEAEADMMVSYYHFYYGNKSIYDVVEKNERKNGRVK